MGNVRANRSWMVALCRKFKFQTEPTKALSVGLISQPWFIRMPPAAEVFQSTAALRQRPQARIGVVILHWGGPDAPENVDAFLQNVYEDPAMVRLPGGRFFRPFFSRAAWAIQRKAIRKRFEAVGGYSPAIRLAEEQARGLQGRLRRDSQNLGGAKFKTYFAMHYWHPFAKDTARRLKRDNIDQVILVPGFLQQFKAGGENVIARWAAQTESNETPRWPAACLDGLASHPLVLRAISERVHQALQRFPRLERKRVKIVFAVSGVPKREEEGYYQQVQRMADIIMGIRGQSAPANVAFYGHFGPINGKGPDLKRTIESMARTGVRDVLVVPLCCITDTIHTTQYLDMACRKSAMRVGIKQYEVAQALNSHGLFLDALAELVKSHLAVPASEVDIVG